MIEFFKRLFGFSKKKKYVLVKKHKDLVIGKVRSIIVMKDGKNVEGPTYWGDRQVQRWHNGDVLNFLDKTNEAWPRFEKGFLNLFRRHIEELGTQPYPQSNEFVHARSTEFVTVNDNQTIRMSDIERIEHFHDPKYHIEVIDEIMEEVKE